MSINHCLFFQFENTYTQSYFNEFILLLYNKWSVGQEVRFDLHARLRKSASSGRDCDLSLNVCGGRSKYIEFIYYSCALAPCTQKGIHAWTGNHYPRATIS